MQTLNELIANREQTPQKIARARGCKNAVASGFSDRCLRPKSTRLHVCACRRLVFLFCFPTPRFLYPPQHQDNTKISLFFPPPTSLFVFPTPFLAPGSCSLFQQQDILSFVLRTMNVVTQPTTMSTHRHPPPLPSSHPARMHTTNSWTSCHRIHARFHSPNYTEVQNITDASAGNEIAACIRRARTATDEPRDVNCS